MAVQKTAEQRFFPRYISVTNRFDGEVFRPATDILLECHVVDVSRDGLGVISNVEVQKGETLELRVLGRVILFQVAYCLEDLIHRGKYRWGLHRTGSAENLVSLFMANGFIDGTEV